MNIFGEAAHGIATGIETTGIGIILAGAVISSILFMIDYIKRKIFQSAYLEYRR